MARPPEPELPREVLDRLASAERVLLHVGRLGASTPLVVAPAPLLGQLYVLLVPDDAARATMEATSAATLSAEAADGSWSVSARGRLLPGPPANVDPRRAELAHWVPDGWPARWMAARFYPEHVEYQTEAAEGRRRAAGPVPGLAPMTRRALYVELVEPMAPWFLVAGVLIGVGILAVAAEEYGRPDVLVVALLAAVLTPVAARVLLGSVDLERFRKGVASEKSLGPLVGAWVAPAELRADGGRIAAGAAVAWVLLVLLGGSVVAGLVSLLSGAPILLLGMALRRRVTEREEGGA